MAQFRKSPTTRECLTGKNRSTSTQIWAIIIGTALLIGTFGGFIGYRIGFVMPRPLPPSPPEPKEPECPICEFPEGTENLTTINLKFDDFYLDVFDDTTFIERDFDIEIGSCYFTTFTLNKTHYDYFMSLGVTNEVQFLQLANNTQCIDLIMQKNLDQEHFISSVIEFLNFPLFFQNISEQEYNISNIKFVDNTAYTLKWAGDVVILERMTLVLYNHTEGYLNVTAINTILFNSFTFFPPVDLIFALNNVEHPAFIIQPNQTSNIEVLGGQYQRPTNELVGLTLKINGTEFRI